MFYKRVYYTAYYIIKDRDLAQDILQETFIKAFYPHALEKYALQSVIDLDEIYIVTYGIKDDKFGLELPGLGFSLTISTSGTDVQFSLYGDEPKIIYPQQRLT